jgi:hypothetical protein
VHLLKSDILGFEHPGEILDLFELKEGLTNQALDSNEGFEESDLDGTTIE